MLFAGLYWGSHSGASDAVRVDRSAAGPGHRLIRDDRSRRVTLDTSSGQAQRYQAFADVTSEVAAAGAGEYTVGGVATTVGQRDRHGAWALVVAYRSASEPPRNLTIFDGLVTVSASSAPVQSIPVTGFRTPATGPVRTTLGFVSYEGDRGSDGDGATLDTTPLSDASNPVNNFFNSTITRGAGHVTTKNPNYLNQLGFDANLINTPGVLSNGATSAVIRVNTKVPDGETYFPGVVTFATELFAPRVESAKSVENLDNPGGPARPGDTLRYTVAFENSGGDAARGFSIADTIPAGTTYAPGSLTIGGVAPDPTDAPGDDQAEFDAGANRVTFRAGSGADAEQGGAIGPGETAAATFDVTVDALPDGATITNQATYDYTAETLGTPLRGETNVVNTPVVAPDLTIAKSHSPPGDFIAGANVTFQLDVSNIGSLGTDGSPVTVTDVLPAASFASVTSVGGTGWTCAPPALAVSCTRADPVGPGGSYPPITIAAQVDDPLLGAVVNTADVAGGGDTNLTNNSATDLGNGASQADLGITKVAEPGTVASGGEVTYTVEVTNRGPSTAEDVTADDLLPAADYANVSASSTQGTCDTTVSCSIGDLAAGATATITITATVEANDETLLNTATASSPTADPEPSNNTATAELIVPNTADLAITKEDEPSAPINPEAGDPYQYTLTVANLGPGAASNVTVTDRIPDILTPTSITAPGWDCNLPGPGEELICTRPSLTPGDGEVTITIDGTLDELGGATTISNSASVGSETVDPDAANNRGDVSNLVLPAADLDLTKSGPARVAPGETAEFVLQLVNRGPGGADDVTVSDDVPGAFRILDVDAPECEASGGAVECDFGDLEAGETREVRITVKAKRSAGGEVVVNTADASSSTPDPIPPSNSAGTTVRIGQGKPELDVTKRANARKARPGEVLGYVIRVRNSGIGDARHVRVCDRLPSDSTCSGRRAPGSGATARAGSCRSSPRAAPRPSG